MKALFLTLVFQFLILTVCASELCISDSISTKNSILVVNDKTQIFDSNFEKLNIQSDTTKKEESNLEKNTSTNKKQKRPKKNRGKLLAVLTFLFGSSSITLCFAAILMAFTHSVGKSLVLSLGLGFIPITFILGFFALRKLKKNAKGKNQSDIYNLLAMAGIALAMIPVGFILFAFALIIVSFIMGDLYM